MARGHRHRRVTRRETQISKARIGVASSIIKGNQQHIVAAKNDRMATSAKIGRVARKSAGKNDSIATRQKKHWARVAIVRVEQASAGISRRHQRTGAGERKKSARKISIGKKHQCCVAASNVKEERDAIVSDAWHSSISRRAEKSAGIIVASGEANRASKVAISSISIVSSGIKWRAGNAKHEQQRKRVTYRWQNIRRTAKREE